MQRGRNIIFRARTVAGRAGTMVIARRRNGRVLDDGMMFINFLRDHMDRLGRRSQIVAHNHACFHFGARLTRPGLGAAMTRPTVSAAAEPMPGAVTSMYREFPEPTPARACGARRR